MISFYLTLGFAQLGSRGEGLTHGLSVDLTSQPEVWAMARLVRQMTTAVWFSATAADRGDRTAAKITQVQDLGQYAGALLFEGG
jgi:hypothetical protein